MLLAGGQAEAAEQNEKDEEIVDGERALQQIPGDELKRALLALRVQHESGEAQRQQEEEAGPDKRGAEARALRLAAKHDKVDDQQRQNNCVKTDPVAEGGAGDHAGSMCIQ